MKKQNDAATEKEENHEPSKGRRAMLKSLVAGSAVVTGGTAIPDKWTKPLTNAVILPAHAQTTGGGDIGVGDGGTTASSPDGYSHGPGSGYSATSYSTFGSHPSAGDYTYGDNYTPSGVVGSDGGLSGTDGGSDLGGDGPA